MIVGHRCDLRGSRKAPRSLKALLLAAPLYPIFITTLLLKLCSELKCNYLPPQLDFNLLSDTHTLWCEIFFKKEISTGWEREGLR